MNEMEFNELITRFSAMTQEQKVLFTTLIPDDLLWGELYARYKHMSELLESVKGVLNTLPQDEAHP